MPTLASGLRMVLSEEMRRSKFSTDDRELGRELTPLGERGDAVARESVP